MDCERSLELLSDFRDGLLEETERVFVDGHLTGCNPCADIFKDLDAIVSVARSFSVEQEITFPDETTFWQRITVTRGTVH